MNQPNKRNELVNKIKEVLENASADNIFNKSFEELAEEVSIYHQELQYQNEELRRSQMELEESRSHFEALFEDAPVGYILCDDEFRIKSANNTFCMLLGCDKRPVNAKINQFIHPDSQDIFYLWSRRLAEAKTQTSVEINMQGRKEVIPVNLEGNRYSGHSEHFFRLTITSLVRQKRTEKMLEQKTHELGERVKELNCINSLFRLKEKPGITTEQLLSEFIEIIPPSWQYPGITCAIIRIDGKEYRTKNFVVSPWFLKASIRVGNKKRGSIEVYYLEEMPHLDEGPFMQEERNLIDNIAQNLGHFLERTENQAKLIASEKKFRSYIENAPYGIFVADQNGNYVEVNKKTSELTGYSEEELLNMNLIDLIAEDDHPKYKDYFSKLRQNGNIEIELRYKTKKGKTREWEISSVQISEGLFLGFASDVTGRKKAQRAILESRENLRITLLSIGDAVIATDTDGKVTRMNPVAEKLTGWPIKQAKEKPLEDVFQIVNSFTDQKVDNPVEKVLKTGSIVGLANHTKLISKTGKEYQISDSGAPIKNEQGKIIGVVLVFRDVTNEYRLQRALHQNEERLRVAAENLDGIVYVLDKKLRVTLSKGRKLDVFGLKADEVVGQTLFDYYNTNNQNHPMIERHRRVLNGETIKIDINRGGTYFTTVISPVKDKDGQITGVLGLAVDITERKLIEEKLKDSELKFRTLVEEDADGLILHDLEGNIRDVNQASVIQYGFSRNELMNMKVQDLDPDYEQRENSGKFFEQLEYNESHRFEAGQMRKSGERFPAEVTITKIKLKEETLIMGLCRDISERKKAEQALKNSEETYRNLFHNAQVGLFRTRIEDGKILESNEQFAKMFGYNNRLEIINRKSVSEHYADTGMRNKMLEIIKANGEIQSFEAPFKRKDGSAFWVLYSARIYPEKGWIEGVAEDITALKKAEETIRQSERQLLTLMSNLPGMAYRCRNDEHWTMEFVSNGCTGLTGYTPEELLHNREVSYSNLIVQEDSDKVWREVQLSKKTGRPFLLEYRIRNKNGEERWVWEQGQIFLSEGDCIEGFIMDVTERKNAENELRELKDDLENQVEEKTKELKERIIELERFHEATIEREFRIKELRDEIERLKQIS